MFDDCDLEDAVYGAISGIFAATGQTCIAGSRLLVQETIHDAFVESSSRSAQIRAHGRPDEHGHQGGAGHHAAAVQEGPGVHRHRHGGGRALRARRRGRDAAECGKGWFVEPTIFIDVRNEMRIAQEEVFGPVLSVIRFKDEADAVRIANDMRFGLAAGVWTRDIGRAVRMSQKLQAGTVWVNTYRAVSFMAPFGGNKHSGIGRESGIEAIKEYLETKSVWLSYAKGAPANPFIMR